MLTCITQTLHMFRFLPTSPIVCRLCSLIHLLLSKCVMHLCYHPDPSYVLIFYLHHILYADLAHPYIYCFLYVLCIYADLYHPDPSYCSDFWPTSPILWHTMYADLAHPYIYHFLNIYMYLCWLGSPRPLHVFRFFTFISHYPLYTDLAHPYIYHFLNIHVSMLTYITQTPSCVQICYLHHTLYADLAYPYILAS